MNRLILAALAAFSMSPAYAIPPPPDPIKPLHAPAPFYPLKAQALHVEGRVTVSFAIQDDGRVDVDNATLTGCDMFFSETRRAMKAWRYPAGHPVNGQYTVIEFKLKGISFSNAAPNTEEKYGLNGCLQLGRSSEKNR